MRTLLIHAHLHEPCLRATILAWWWNMSDQCRGPAVLHVFTQGELPDDVTSTLAILVKGAAQRDRMIHHVIDFFRPSAVKIVDWEKSA